jgi:hypothetical protein
MLIYLLRRPHKILKYKRTEYNNVLQKAACEHIDLSGKKLRHTAGNTGKGGAVNGIKLLYRPITESQEKYTQTLMNWA